MCDWKMAKDIGTAIRKSILVSFLPYLDDFLGSHPYMVLHFFKMFIASSFTSLHLAEYYTLHYTPLHSFIALYSAVYYV